MSKSLYDDLIALARRHAGWREVAGKPGAASLVHVAWDRLHRAGERAYGSRAELLAAYARTMRSVVVDHARRRAADKRGARRQQQPLEEDSAMQSEAPEEVLAIEEALTELESLDAEAARFVEQRYFVGLGLEETAEVLGFSRSSAIRKWKFICGWLARRLKQSVR